MGGWSGLGTGLPKPCCAGVQTVYVQLAGSEGAASCVLTQDSRLPKPRSRNEPLWPVTGDISHGEPEDRAPRRGGRGRARDDPSAPGDCGAAGPRDEPNSSHCADSPAGPGGLKPPGRLKFCSFQNRRKSPFVWPRLMINNPRHRCCPRHRPWGAAGLSPPAAKGSGPSRGAGGILPRECDRLKRTFYRY